MLCLVEPCPRRAVRQPERIRVVRFAEYRLDEIFGARDNVAATLEAAVVERGINGMWERVEGHIPCSWG